MKVITRDFNPDQDTGFIYSTWAKSVYYGNRRWHGNDSTKQEWFKDFYVTMSEALGTGKIRIACLEDDRDLIIGYSVLVESVCEFVYVKEALRRQGIATLLLKGESVFSFNVCTRMGAKIIAERALNGTKEETRSNMQDPT